MDIQYKLAITEETDDNKKPIEVSTTTIDTITIDELVSQRDAIIERAARKAQEFQDSVDALNKQINEIGLSLKLNIIADLPLNDAPIEAEVIQ